MYPLLILPLAVFVTSAAALQLIQGQDLGLGAPYTKKAVDPYKLGPYGNTTFNATEGPCVGQFLGSCTSLKVVVAPQKKGTYPLVVFQHGFFLGPFVSNGKVINFYADLLNHVASWGFIVVAPEMYSHSDAAEFLKFNAQDEIEDAAKIINWLAGNLNRKLDTAMPGVRADTSVFALAGHSRGGKVAAGLATGKGGLLALQVGSLAALDPVDGVANWLQTRPYILNHTAFPYDHVGAKLNFAFPALYVGTGLGSLSCAPASLAHREFYAQTTSEAYHVNATENGHMDFGQTLGDGWLQRLTGLCASPTNSTLIDDLRSASSGLIVSFLKSKLIRDTAFDAAFGAVFQNKSILVPVVAEFKNNKTTVLYSHVISHS